WTSNDFRPRDKKGARAALNLPPDKVIALNVGSCALNKNLQLLQAISRALSDEVLTVQIGGGSAAASRPSGYHQVVEQVPPQTLPLYYNAADLYVATSTAEGFCFPVIEAVNSGLPVIASPIDTFSETLRGSPVYREVIRIGGLDRSHFASDRASSPLESGQ
ncbi:mannosyltransferase, partial [mine drainage metagenome]